MDEQEHRCVIPAELLEPSNSTVAQEQIIQESFRRQLGLESEVEPDGRKDDGFVPEGEG